GSMSRQASQQANQQLSEMRNNVRSDVRLILENFSEMLSLAKPEPVQAQPGSLSESSTRIATVTQTSQDYLELSTRAANLVRACHLLKRQVLEMKRASILDDFSWMHNVKEIANTEERKQLIEMRRALEDTRDRLLDIQYDLEEEACAANVPVVD
ncbi:hypothetical protein BOX15_Mlig031501g2, partial [Macrostomum lignano]